MINVRKEMVFDLEIESPWEKESKFTIDTVVSTGNNLMYIPILMEWMSTVFMDMSDLSINHKQQAEHHHWINTEHQSLSQLEIHKGKY